MAKQNRIALGAVGLAAVAFLAAVFSGVLDDQMRQLGLLPAPVEVAGETSVEATAPAADAGATTAALPVAPVFDLVRVEPSGDAVIAGQGVANSKVEILSGADVIASGQTNSAGEWAIVLQKPLAAGAHDLKIRMTLPDGRVVESEQTVAVSVPEGGNGEVLVVLNAPGTPSTVLQVPGLAEAQKPVVETAGKPVAPAETEVAAVEPAAQAPAATVATAPAAEADGSSETPAAETPVVTADAGTEASQAAAPATAEPAVTAEAAKPAQPAVEPAAAPIRVTVEAVELENGTKFFAAGSAAPGSNLRVYVDAKAVGDVTAMPTGRWLLETTLALEPGDHVVRVDQVDAAGTVIARAEVPYQIAAEVAVAPSGATGTGEAAAGSGPVGEARVAQTETLIIRRGDNLWRIAQRLYGDGVRYSTIYEANVDQIRNPDLIYPGQVFVLPEGDTNWVPIETVQGTKSADADLKPTP